MKEKRSLIAIQLTAQRKRLIYLSFISLALGAAIVSQAALLAEAVQQIFVEKASLSSVALLLGILLVVMTMRTLLSLGNATVGLQMAATAKINMRAAVLENFMHASMPSSLQGQTGERSALRWMLWMRRIVISVNTCRVWWKWSLSPF